MISSTQNPRVCYFDWEFIENVTGNSDITEKEIETHLKKDGQILYAKRITASKSLAYLILKNKRAAKILIHRKKRKVLSILPWKASFSISYNITEDIENYKVILFPDCYIETKNKGTLTKIFDTTNLLDIKHINYGHFDFINLFDIAWSMWEEGDGKENKIKN